MCVESVDDPGLTAGEADRLDTEICQAMQARHGDSLPGVNMSISRPGCVLETSLASLMRLSVVLPIALGTTTHRGRDVG